MYNNSMDDRDSNWGTHGNPNREEWYKFKNRHSTFGTYDIPPKKITVSLETIFWIILAVLLISALVPAVREWIFASWDFTQSWYDAVDDILDAMHAPKVPH